jgi:hypothetical protein
LETSFRTLQSLQTLQRIFNKYGLTEKQLFQFEQLFLKEYLPTSLIKLFSQYDWIFDWKMVGTNKRWVAIIDRQLSQYYNEKENKLDLYSFNENELKRMKETLKTRHQQLTKVKKHIDEMLDQYGDEFCSYLETKLVGKTNNL